MFFFLYFGIVISFSLPLFSISFSLSLSLNFQNILQIYIYKAALSVCVFVCVSVLSDRPHGYPGATLQDRLARGQPHGRNFIPGGGGGGGEIVNIYLLCYVQDNVRAGCPSEQTSQRVHYLT